MSKGFESVKIKDIQRETEDCVSLELEIPTHLEEKFTFSSGQYLTFKTTVDKEEIRRSYSLCSAPFENTWRVAIKRVENGLFSNYAIQKLEIGAFIDVLPPMGNFTYNKDSAKKNIVLFAAGSGITPVISIAKTALKESKQNVTLFYGNKGFGEVIFREELENLKNTYMNRFRVIHVFSRENLGNPLQKGRIDEEKCEKLYTAFLKDEDIGAVFVCGPQQMILAVKNTLISKGLNEQDIHFELFGTPTAGTEKKQVVRDSLATKVEIVIDDDSIEFDLNASGPTILDAAQHAGADLPFACKGGVCCTCKAKVLDGNVEMDVIYALTTEELADGYVLTCQAHPVSKFVKISFDD